MNDDSFYRRWQRVEYYNGLHEEKTRLEANLERLKNANEQINREVARLSYLIESGYYRDLDEKKRLKEQKEWQINQSQKNFEKSLALAERLNQINEELKGSLDENL